MLKLRYFYLLCLLLISLGVGHAQTGDKAGDNAGDKAGGQAGEAPAASSAWPRTLAEADARRKAWFEQCMKDWDKGTHMSKAQWDRTCRRMAEERMKYLLERGR